MARKKSKKKVQPVKPKEKVSMGSFGRISTDLQDIKPTIGLLKLKPKYKKEKEFPSSGQGRRRDDDIYMWTDISLIEKKLNSKMKMSDGEAWKLTLCKKCEWKNIHQPWELGFHKMPNFREDDVRWKDQWDKIFIEFMEITPSYFTNEGVLLDVGCGSRPCLDWFDEGVIHHLDPLLDKYLEIDKVKPYWENKTFLYSQPAESLVKSLVGKCDYIHCWNVLDHTYNWKQILENITLYSKKGTMVLLGTDLHSTPHIGHPGISNKDEFFNFINEHFNIIKEQYGYVSREVALKLERK
jgi:2-polyprenyl-3-methyl-5-hydroxy-6-metoxy-1,4-benzoquinol methylase